jgi:hypothetical protein
LAAFLLFFAIAFAFQHTGGAYRSELSGYPDEPAHFVTGVMFREYFATFPPVWPVPFAVDYYIHYPKVAIGHWPPVFYVLEGLWFALFGPSREAAMLLMALISALLSLTIHGLVRRHFGAWAGIAAGILFQCLPEVRIQTGRLMMDMLVALFGLLAAVAFAEFARTRRGLDAFRFACLAALAVFTKGNGLFIALVPVFTVVLTRRPGLLLRPVLWLSATPMALLSAAWMASSSKYVFSTWTAEPGLGFFWHALWINGRFVVSAFGVPFVGLICAGLFVKACRPFLRHGSDEPLWAALASVAASVYILQCVASAGLEGRFMLPALAALMPFLFAGVEWLAQITAPVRGTQRLRAVAVFSCAALVFAHQVHAVPAKEYLGFSDAAALVLSRPESRGAAILVSSQTDGEGLFISEVVARRTHPECFTLRASKVLSRADWLGRYYRPRFNSPEEIGRYLEDIPVDFVVIDTRSGATPLLHHRHLEELIRRRAGTWQLLATFPRQGSNSGTRPNVLLYMRNGAPGDPAQKVRLEMSRVLYDTLNR